MRQQPLTRIFHQVQHRLEPGRTLVIRVGYHGGIKSLAKLGEAAQFVLVLRRAADLKQRQVVPVHGQNQVKRGVVGVLNLPCAQG